MLLLLLQPKIIPLNSIHLKEKLKRRRSCNCFLQNPVFECLQPSEELVFLFRCEKIKIIWFRIHCEYLHCNLTHVESPCVNTRDINELQLFTEILRNERTRMAAIECLQSIWNISNSVFVWRKLHAFFAYWNVSIAAAFQCHIFAFEAAIWNEWSHWSLVWIVNILFEIIDLLRIFIAIIIRDMVVFVFIIWNFSIFFIFCSTNGWLFGVIFRGIMCFLLEWLSLWRDLWLFDLFLCGEVLIIECFLHRGHQRRITCLSSYCKASLLLVALKLSWIRHKRRISI